MRLAFWLYEGTALHGISRVTNSMKGVHTVYHAPQGDDYITATYSMLERTPDFPGLSISVVREETLPREFQDFQEHCSRLISTIIPTLRSSLRVAVQLSFRKIFTSSQPIPDFHRKKFWFMHSIPSGYRKTRQLMVFLLNW